MSGKRPYTLRARARGQEDTRRRIVEAAMALHEEVGPRATTISAIAARAGVQRLTVYRHFPDEAAVFAACTGHWLTLHPLPAPPDWEGAPTPATRRHAAVDAFHRYYAGTRAMWAASHRDVAFVPALEGPMAAVGAYLDEVAAALGRDLGPLARASLRHALAFPTWDALETLGLDPEAKTRLVRAWIAGAAAADAGLDGEVG
jgi:AcrR family transcriptional regulator